MIDRAEQEIRAFVGPKSDYYLGKWRSVLNGESDKVGGLNYAAFFFEAIWLIYRKMY